MLEKNEENITGFYLKVNNEIQRQFKIKCLENDKTMTEEIQRLMQEYIEKK